MAAIAAMAASERPTPPAPAFGAAFGAASWAHFVFVRLALDLEPDADGLLAYSPPDPQADWLAVCRRLTARVERCSRSPASALLDLGCCTAAEAVDAVQGLMAHLAQLGLRARAGIGPSGCLAELALLRAPTSVSQRSQRSPQPISLPISLVSPADAPALLRATPVALLPRLRDAQAVTPAVVERLHRYGLRTLGHLARLGELTLHRQFGTPAGSVLAALASGRDPRPLAPTPPPACLRARLCLSSDTAGNAGDAGSAAPEQVLALLPTFTARIAAQLGELGEMGELGTQVRTLHLTLCWESGARQHVTRTLRQHTRDARLLVAELRRMLVPLLQPAPGVPGVSVASLLTELRLTLLDFAPVAPEQQTFWRVRAQRLSAIEGMADTLTRRHGRPLLLSPHLVAPDAVFSEERHVLTHPLPALSAPRGTSARAVPLLADTWQSSPHADVRDGQPDAWQEIPHHLHWW